MTMHEYGTIMEYGVNVKIILLNNNFWESVRQWQELFLMNDIPEHTRRTPIYRWPMRGIRT